MGLKLLFLEEKSVCNKKANTVYSVNTNVEFGNFRAFCKADFLLVFL